MLTKLSFNPLTPAWSINKESSIRAAGQGYPAFVNGAWLMSMMGMLFLFLNAERF